MSSNLKRGKFRYTSIFILSAIHI